MNVQTNKALKETVNGLHLTLEDCGYAVLDDHWRSAPFSSPFSRLYLVESGEGLLYTDTQRIRMAPGVVYLVPAGLRFGYRCDRAMTKLYFHVELTKPEGTDLLQSFGSIVQLPMEKSWMDSLMRHFLGNSYADALAVRECLFRILHAFDRHCAIARGRGEHRSVHVADTAAYIQNHLSAALGVKELAARRFVSQVYLERLFREEMGMSLGQYIDGQLMETAQWWLEQTDRSVACISQELGYQDPAYFSRRFKQLRGVSPTEYRRRVRR